MAILPPDPPDPRPEDDSDLMTAPPSRLLRLRFAGILVALATIAGAAELGLINLSPATARQIVLAQAESIASAAQTGLIDPNVVSTTRMLAQAELVSCEQEYHSVQDGLGAYMWDNNLKEMPAANTSDMTSPVLLYVMSPTATNPSYVSYPQTEWCFGWDSTGRVHSISSNPNGPHIPMGCVPAG